MARSFHRLGTPDTPPLIAAGLSFVIPGPARTKKNHGRRVWSRKQKRAVHVPSEAYEHWASASVIAIPAIQRAAQAAGIQLPIREKVNCAALFYRDTDAGDAVGFYQGLADWLESVGVVENDRQIVSWDGARLRKDPVRPRTEVLLSPATPHDRGAATEGSGQ